MKEKTHEINNRAIVALRINKTESLTFKVFMLGNFSKHNFEKFY